MSRICIYKYVCACVWGGGGISHNSQTYNGQEMNFLNVKLLFTVNGTKDFMCFESAKNA